MLGPRDSVIPTRMLNWGVVQADAKGSESFLRCGVGYASLRPCFPVNLEWKSPVEDTPCKPIALPGSG